MEGKTTLKYVQKLRPRVSNYGSGNLFTYVNETLGSKADKETYDALQEYTSGMYTIELRYKSLFNYRRLITEDNSYSNALLSHPSFNYAFNRVHEELKHIRVSPIPTNHLDEVYYQPPSAAGYGYIGPKWHTYLLARRNASRALFDFGRFRNKYRFVPDLAYARCQLVLRAALIRKSDISGDAQSTTSY
ncbi:unnamed protein product [Bemisia tabaci]|uniref:Uncharacterized protein n=1 Tax=Bemisia tabaci TaxID=7038 RepID=A0A9P0F4C1_BEMTA|nr:unnamed protein product [Bemisia tabaci]